MKTFWTNVKICIGKYVCFSGNATRGEFWHWALFVALSGMDSTPPEIPLLYCYAYLTFTAAVCLLYVKFLNRAT